MRRRLCIRLSRGALFGALAALFLWAAPVNAQPTKQKSELPPLRPPAIDRDPGASPTRDPIATVTGLGPIGGQVEVFRMPDHFEVVPTQANGRFSIDVPLLDNHVNHMYFTAILKGDRSAPAPYKITRDNQKPTLFIDFPVDGAEIGSPWTDVSGRVGDVLSGFQHLTVTVNGKNAEVDKGLGTNGTFFFRDLQLVPDQPNLIEAVASDAVGNSVTRSITVTRVKLRANEPIMKMQNGNGQSAPVGQMLLDPIEIAVFRRDVDLDTPGPEEPFANKLVTFTVTRSDGRLAADPVSGPGKSFFQTRTDENGLARAYWTVGSDVGCGNNRVTVTSNGIQGTIVFCASASSSGANRINVGSGNNQIAEAGALALEPLRVWVNDGNNSVPGQQVLFSVLEGGGKVNGQNTALVVSDDTGHAEVELTLGSEEGVNRVEAHLTADLEIHPASFEVYGLERNDDGTTFSGLVVDNADRPIGGATVTLKIGPTALPSTVSDERGQFRFEDIQGSGFATLHVDGTTAHLLAGEPIPTSSFPVLLFMSQVIPDAANGLATPVKLPPLDPANSKTYDGDASVTLTIYDPQNPGEPLIEGLEFVVLENTIVTLQDDTVIGPGPGPSVELSLNPVHYDKIPMPMPDGAAPPLAWTLQPAGAHFDPPVEVHLPNMAGLPPDSIAYILSYDHDIEQFVIVSSAEVSSDGLSIVSDKGSGIAKAGWGGFCPPYPNTGNASGAPPGGGDGLDDEDDPPATNGEEKPPAHPDKCDPSKTCCDDQQEHGPPGPDSDPVQAFSGELYLQDTDLQIKGRGLDFTWSRRYNSKRGSETTMGHGWDHSYNIFIEDDGSGNRAVCNGNGRRDVYRAKAAGVYSRSGIFRELDETQGPPTLTFAGTGKWVFNPLDGSPAAGKISQIVDRNGNTLDFDYDAQGRLVTIHDTLDDRTTHNRDITIAYNSDGFIQSVTDWTGRQVTYAYYQDAEVGGSDGDLKSVTTPVVNGTPNGNDYPAGKTTVYTYSEGTGDAELDHNLLTITDPKGQTFVQNTYAATQNPMDLDYDRVARQVWGDAGDIIDFVYVPVSPTKENGQAVVKTIVNDREGHVKEYFYDDKNRAVRFREYTGLANPDQATTENSNRPTGKLRPSDPDFFETRYVWNSDWLLTRQIDPNGTVTAYMYERDLNPNAPARIAGNLRVKVRRPGSHLPKGDQPQIVELFEYATDLGGCCGTNFVTRHVDGRGNELLHEYDGFGNRTRTEDRIAGIVTDFEYNQFGQMTARVLPGNGSGNRRRDELTYYGTSDGAKNGYQKELIVDAPGLGLTTTYDVDGLGRVTQQIDPKGQATAFVYNELDQVVREISRDVDGNGLRYERDRYFDANDNLVRIDVQNVDDAGQIVSSNPYLTTIHEYEVLNHLVRTCQESGSHDVTRMPPQLDCQGLPAAEFVTTEFEYDDNRNRTLVRYGEAVEGRQPANTLTMLYDERDLLFQEIRAAGAPDQSTVQYDYDGNKNLVRRLDGLEGIPHVTTRVYDAYDRLVSETDPMGNVTTMGYDANGNVVSVRVDGELVDVDGDSSNVRLSEVSFEYDAMNRLTRQETAFFDTETQQDLQGGQGLGISVAATSWTNTSQVLETVNDNGHATFFTYDTANRLQRTTDAKSNTVDYGYDANSNVLTQVETEKDDLGGGDQVFTTTFEYDGLDRLTKTIDNVGNANESFYDSRDNRTKTLDALSHEIRYEYDGLDRLTATIRDLDGDGADGGGPADPDIRTAQTWDDTSRLTSQTDDNGNTTTYVYDALGRKVSEVMADCTQHDWTYDVHDNAVVHTDANGSVVNSVYDENDRVIAKSITPGPGVSNDTTSETWAYDGLSRVVLAQDDDSLVTRAYDSLSNVLRETLNGQTTASLFDGMSNQVQCTYPSGRIIVTTYDELERKKLITDETDSQNIETIASYDYVGPGRVARKTFGNGVVCDYDYDGITGIPNQPGDFGVKQIVGTTHVFDPQGANTVIDSRTYQWDPMYNKTQRADTRDGGPELTHDYSYDAIYRLVDTVVTDASQAVVRHTEYQLDGVGNRQIVTENGVPGTYTMLDTACDEPADYRMNQYTTTPFDARDYDANGNLTFIDQGLPTEKAITYDYRNMMVEYQDTEAGQRHTYAYDALGRRIVRIVDADGTPDETRYFYDGWQVVEEQDSVGTATEIFVRGNYLDEVLLSDISTQRRFYGTGSLSNILVATDANGQVLERYDYKDFGETIYLDPNSNPLADSAIANRYTFTGRESDSESGFYYYRARHLDSTIGRFLSRDRPNIWSDAPNLGGGTSYVGNSPQTYVDPFGRKRCNRLLYVLMCVWNLTMMPPNVPQSPTDWLPGGGPSRPENAGMTYEEWRKSRPKWCDKCEQGDDPKRRRKDKDKGKNKEKDKKGGSGNGKNKGNSQGQSKSSCPVVPAGQPNAQPPVQIPPIQIPPVQIPPIRVGPGVYPAPIWPVGAI